MSIDLTEVIDDYCRSKYGHTNWQYYNKEEHFGVSDDIAVVEGNIIFYYEPYEGEGECQRLVVKDKHGSVLDRRFIKFNKEDK